MSIDRNILSEFVKITNDTNDTKQLQLYGTVVTQDGSKYIKIDGSDILTPVRSTTDIKDNERVIVSIDNHMATITGNMTNPSVGNDRVENAEGKIDRFDHLFAGNITAENIAANSITTDKLMANSITTDKLMAESITADKIAANSITSKHITSQSITADKIDAKVITSDHIASNTITADNIATNTITAGSGIIAEGAIGSAQISSLDVAKLESGTIDTSKIYIAGADGHLQLKGNRLQVFDGLGNSAVERVSVGDVNGDGSKFGLRVRGADGETILLDENGVTSEGITDGSITNNKISDDANIDGAKLNINSVVSKINEDGTETIRGTKIQVGDSTLEVKLSEISIKQDENNTKITEAQADIEANTNSIKLKVDEQIYNEDKKNMTSNIEKNTSEINILKEEISLKVEHTDIENIKTDIEESVNSKIESAKSEIKITTDDIYSKVSKTEQIALSSEGKMLYADLTFLEGTNDILPYNGLANGMVTVERINRTNDCPTSSPYMLEVKTVGDSYPFNGGITFHTPTRANAIFVTKILAKLPYNTELSFHTNPIGEDSKYEWLTSTYGTGEWEEYICKIYCGKTGEFSSTNYFALKGGEKPITWHIAMATSYDLTDTNNILSRLSTAESRITDESITNIVSKGFYTSEQTEEAITSKGYQTSSQVQQMVDALQLKFVQSGGYNLVYNGNFKNQFDRWRIESDGWNFGDQMWSPDGRGVFCDGNIGVTKTVYALEPMNLDRMADAYTLSYWINTSSWGTDGTTNPFRCAELTIYYTDGTASWHSVGKQNSYDIWEKHVLTVHRPPDKQFSHFGLGLWVRDTTKRVHYSMIMMEKGTLPTEWTPNPNEAYNSTITMNNGGITVAHTNIGAYSKMSQDSFRINKNGSDMFIVDSNGLRIREGDIQVSHSDGSYTKMSYDGLKRYEGGTGRSYHYLMHSGTVQCRSTVTVALPSHISGKVGTNYTVAISARGYGFDDWNSTTLQQLYMVVKSKTSTNFVIETTLYGLKVNNNTQTIGGWVNIDYTIIA